MWRSSRYWPAILAPKSSSGTRLYSSPVSSFPSSRIKVTGRRRSGLFSSCRYMLYSVSMISFCFATTGFSMEIMSVMSTSSSTAAGMVWVGACRRSLLNTFSTAGRNKSLAACRTEVSEIASCMAAPASGFFSLSFTNLWAASCSGVLCFSSSKRNMPSTRPRVSSVLTPPPLELASLYSLSAPMSAAHSSVICCLSSSSPPARCTNLRHSSWKLRGASRSG
mmetsp:Transcript_32439/g.58168  ORF Transcript_32439/g.58168 Transcript_32439/m.58168 type:complete len:222 (-) Transcript_32439:851-1516(-)